MIKITHHVDFDFKDREASAVVLSVRSGVSPSVLVLLRPEGNPVI